jgi:hypothetical protein
MKKSRYTPEQVVYALKQAESGAETVAAICRKMGVSEATFYNWKLPTHANRLMWAFTTRKIFRSPIF